MSTRVPRKTRAIAEFGDFQTPAPLALEVCELLRKRGAVPASILEPTCGQGCFLAAALAVFDDSARRAVGLDINASYVAAATELLRSQGRNSAQVMQGDFFETDWTVLLRDLPPPLLVVGNPPWVTNSALGGLGSANVPQKMNFQNHSGIEALTGKSNFDISEWMLLRLVELLQGNDAVLAMLCKTAVARKVLATAWTRGWKVGPAQLRSIDAKAHFGAAVDAGLLILDFNNCGPGNVCDVFSSLDAASPSSVVALREGVVVADAVSFDRWHHLQGTHTVRWRSGVKHDCTKVFELARDGNRFTNGFGESVELEKEHVFPLFKGSDLVRDSELRSNRWLLVTQRTTGEDTQRLEIAAPHVWKYLQSHADIIARRGSVIYRGRPPFSVFGVGAYSFAPWKVAVSALHKQLRFQLVGPIEERPALLDDTCYFVPCDTRAQAEAVLVLLRSRPATDFLTSLIFWDAKRPITVEVLQRLDLDAVAAEVGMESASRELVRNLLTRRKPRLVRRREQRSLFT